MAGEFNSPVAKQDPNISTQEFGITCDKVGGVDCEKNRYIMLNSFEDGLYVGEVVKNMQRELIPSCTTSLINVEYQVEALIVHDATFGSGSVEIPSISFPVIIGRDPEGPFDQGNDGMVAAQMAQQQQFYAAQVMQPGQAIQ